MKSIKKRIITGFTASLLLLGQAALGSETATTNAERFQPYQVADAELPWIKGKVVKISVKRGIVTIAHEEISNLSMPKMTMGFKSEDESVLQELQPGDEIEFQTHQIDGKLILLHYRRSAS